MLYYTIGQWRVFAAMCVTGLACGAWYGLIRRVGRLLGAGFWLGALLDGINAGGVFALFALGLVIACYGDMRIYALMGALIGFTVYRLTVAALLNRALDTAHLWLLRSARWAGGARLTKILFK